MPNDYSSRDKNAKVTFYVLLWKRNGITMDDFDNYWRDVHGPVCSRLPGQFQYWQFHVAHDNGGIFPAVPGVVFNETPAASQFDGIAELTFKSVEDRQTWFTAAGILMDDEHNIFSKAIGYVTDQGNSITYIDKIEDGDPNGGSGGPGIRRFHVMVKKSETASVQDFRAYLKDTFAANVIKSDKVLKLRLHLFEPPDLSRPDAAGVAHSESENLLCQAAFEIAFKSGVDMENFFASKEYAAAVVNQAKFVKQISPFPERDAYAFVYNSKMTLTGRRGSRTADLITRLGAINQIRDDIANLIGIKEPNE